MTSALEPTSPVGLGPHWRSRSSVTQMNYAGLLALLPAAAIGCVWAGFGPGAATEVGPDGGLLVAVVRVLVRELGIPPNVLSMAGAAGVVCLAVGTALLVESGVQLIFRRRDQAADGHGALMGMLLGLMMPPTVPGWVVVVGVAVAIVVGKQVFGGIGRYYFHPAMVGWMALLLLWPRHIYPVGAESIVTMHWLSIYLTALGGVALIALGHVRWPLAVGTLAGVFIFGLLFHALHPDQGPGEFYRDALTELVTGHVMLAAFFIVTDSTTSPVNRVPMLLYGLGTGGLIVLIRTDGAWPDAIPFAVLIMNLLRPALDRIRPKVRGRG